MRVINRSAVLAERWPWRHETRGAIVNTDIDGLLTGALLHHLLGVDLIGFYDTDNLWVAEGWLPLEPRLSEILWVDCDMCWPGCRSLAQHVITETDADAEHVAAYASSVNPSLIGGHSASVSYRSKYPFGTFQWAWWLAGLDPPTPHDELRSGLLWMPDGGLFSNFNQYRDNCQSWIYKRLEGGVEFPMRPLGKEPEPAVAGAVQHAEARLRAAVGTPAAGTFERHQYKMTLIRGGSTNLLCDPSETQGADEVQRVLQAIARAFGWPAATVPTGLAHFRGQWTASDRPPLGWPGAANERQVVSMAVTRQSGSRYCYTLPDAPMPGVASLRQAFTGAA